ncbi:MAG: hypothetical protein KAS72_13825 [Phycisphaerales bacterium]|nr:hypothetical protein [Phycisphaerales bacterium]
MTGNPVQLTIIRGQWVTLLGSLTALFTLSSLLVPLIRIGIGSESWLRAVEIVYVGAERSIPTWFAALLLALAAFLLVIIAVEAQQAHEKYIVRWWGLSLIFLALSVDEIATLHERLGGLMEDQLQLGGALRFAWVIPLGMFALLVGLAYIPLLLSLPRGIAVRFAVAGMLFLLGALGMELVSAHFVSVHGESVIHKSAIYALMNIVEEILEMVGVIVFIDALLRYLTMRGVELRVTLV